MDERAWPSTAEALMRSRFEACRDADVGWLRASWGDVRVLHEPSRFVREHCHSYYVDGDEQTGSRR